MPQILKPPCFTAGKAYYLLLLLWTLYYYACIYVWMY